MMAAAGRETVGAFLEDIIPPVRSGLCDDEPTVREAAARAFSTLQRLVGPQAINEIVPALLSLLRSDDAESVSKGQAGLREVMGQRPQAVVPYLLPKLIAPPIKLSHARALAAVAEVAGAALHMHLDSLVPALLAETYLEAEITPAGKTADPALRDALVGAASAVALAVEDDGLHYLVQECRAATAIKSPPHVRVAGAALIETLCKSCTHDLSPYHPSLIEALVGLLVANDAPVQRGGIRGLDVLVKSLPKERYPLHVSTLRDGLADVAAEHKQRMLSEGVAPADAATLPALCLPGGLGPLVAIYLQGLMTGTPELREQSAAALGEAVACVTPAALKPYVIQITGPLIRIVGDRFPSGVKAAILHTLTLLIAKGAILLKPFVPQLQTTFVKALADPTNLVRTRGSTALSKLVPLATRVEPLATELHNSLVAAEADTQTAYLSALAGVLRGVAKPLSDALLAKLQTSALELLRTDDPDCSRGAASLLGALGRTVDVGELLDAIEEASEVDAAEEWISKIRVVRAQQALLRTVPTATLTPVLSTIFATLGHAARSDKIDVRQPAAHALARLASHMATPAAEDIAETEAEGGDIEELAQATSAAVPHAIYDLLVALLNDKVMEVRTSAMRAVKALCKLRPPLLRAADCHVASIFAVPIIALGCGDNRHLPVNNAAQRTLMHICNVCGWTENLAPPELEKVDRTAAEYVANFAKATGTMRRLAGLESEAEYSDVDA